MSVEKNRLTNKQWKQWGPYISERQWGTVREDYSANGEPWLYTTHEMARSKAWRWGEEAIGGWCDAQQLFCFAPTFWNKKDPIIKERLFGLSGPEGNHGEDVKEMYYYLDGTPSHSYMKMLYKYPQTAFPYQQLLQENKKRSRNEPEYELIDTGIFNDNQYFDIFIEYAKLDTDDILIRLSIFNRYHQPAAINVLPTIWFRNTWAWGYDDYKPNLFINDAHSISIQHSKLTPHKLYYDGKPELIFCDNETNTRKIYGNDNGNRFYKDAVNEYLLNNQPVTNTDNTGTKAALNYNISVAAHQSVSIKLRLAKPGIAAPFEPFDETFVQRIAETNSFYKDIQKETLTDDERNVQRQAFAGMLWSKQFYYYDVAEWLKGDPNGPTPPASRKSGRNNEWPHLNNADIISMPDKWEYPWYAAWDLAFHCITLALLDPVFAKKQMRILTHEWYMHPNGQLPAYEWALGDANPPVHAWATYKIYELDKKNNAGKGDTVFLETVFHKLLLNFTWWVNRKDESGNNVFEGGFLGMDNIGPFDRSMSLPDGAKLQQSDGTSWMAMYALNMMRIALELSDNNPVYQDMATKFFEHFMYIAGAMVTMGEVNDSLWNEQDEFYYDVVKLRNGVTHPIQLKSMVGLIPLFAVEIIHDELLQRHPKFARRLRWFLENRPELADLVSRWGKKGCNEMHLLSLLRGHRMKRILYRMLDETEFLSAYGVRSMSKYHQNNPYLLDSGIEKDINVHYAPGDSPVGLFGGNSNWRGPIWMPVNYLLIESLKNFHQYYGDDFKVEYPTHSGNYFSLQQISDELAGRLKKLFLKDDSGKRPSNSNHDLLWHDEHFNNYILFHEFFQGDTGQGLGASHQTGWTGLIANLF